MERERGMEGERQKNWRQIRSTETDARAHTHTERERERERCSKRNTERV
jgi:hypothetical protein